MNFASTVYALFMCESWSESPLALNGRNREMDGAFVYFMYFNFIASKRGSVRVHSVFLSGKGKHVVK